MKALICEQGLQNQSHLSAFILLWRQGLSSRPSAAEINTGLSARMNSL